MDIVNRARNIIVHPAAEWVVIDQEPSSIGDLYTKYLVPLGLIGPIASFIGLTVIGVSIPFIGTYRTPLLGGLASAVTSFVAVLVGVYIWALIIDALAPTFSGQRNIVAALKVAVFAATPALLAGILSLLPALAALQVLAALYGLYLLYRGLPVLMKSPPAKAAGYTALTVVSGFVVGIVLGAILMALHFTPVFGQPTSMLQHSSDDAVAQSVVAGALGAAAGGSDESKKAAESVVAGVVAAADADAAVHKSTAEAAPSQAGSDGAAAAAGMAAIGAFVGGGKAQVATVDFHSLKELLPTAVGSLPRSNALGEQRDMAGLKVSTAEGDYADSGTGRVTLKITDMGNAGGLLAIGKLALATESESDTGYEKNVVIGGRKVHEKWTSSGKTSELTAFVSDRFLVEINGNGVEMPIAESALTSVDLDKLAAMKG